MGDADEGDESRGIDKSNLIPPMTQVACGLKHSVVVTDTGRLIVFGGGKFGQLGTERIVDFDAPIEANDGYDNDGSDSLRGKAVIQSNGYLYSWGLEDKGRLGHVDTVGFVSSQRGGQMPRNPEAPCLVRSFLDERVFPGTVRVKQVACGADHTICVDHKGDVFTWGLGAFGNLGHGDTLDVYEPKKVHKLTGRMIKQVDAGAKHSLALTARGDVWAFGHGENGRLGQGQAEGSLVPVVIDALQGLYVVGIASGEAHNAALTDTGVLLTWGAGSYGRLGHGEEVDQAAPREVSALSGEHVTFASCGGFHTLAVTKSGRVYAWGGGLYGKLGLGDTMNRPVPVQVLDFPDDQRVTQVSCGTFHSMACTDLGRVFVWGFGGSGRLGLGEMNSRPRPALHDGLSGIGKVSGMNAEKLRGEASSGGAASEDAATQSRKKRELKARSARMVAAGAQHTMALTQAGRVFTWGENQCGQLGHGGTKDEYLPRMLEGVMQRIKMVRVACGTHHSMALSFRGDLYVWGRGEEGQLGTGRAKGEDQPILLQALAGAGVQNMAAGETHSAAIDREGNVYTWGANDMGKLGLGPRVGQQQLLPQRVGGALDGVPIKQLDCGVAHTAALSRQGQVFTWGGGWYGRLGHGSVDNVYTPRLVDALKFREVTQVSCGSYHSLAVTRDGDLYIWGRGDQRLGVGDTADVMEPMLLPMVRQDQVTVTHAVAAGEHTLMMGSTGMVWAWGRGRYGKLGVAHTEAVNLPTTVFTSSDELSLGVFEDQDVANGDVDIRALSSSTNHVVALDRFGRVFTWGCGGSGRLGHGDTASLAVATPISGTHFPMVENERAQRRTAQVQASSGGSGNAPRITEGSGVAADGSIDPTTLGVELQAGQEGGGAGSGAAGGRADGGGKGGRDGKGGKGGKDGKGGKGSKGGKGGKGGKDGGAADGVGDRKGSKKSGGEAGHAGGGGGGGGSALGGLLGALGLGGDEPQVADPTSSEGPEDPAVDEDVDEEEGGPGGEKGPEAAGGQGEGEGKGKGKGKGEGKGEGKGGKGGAQRGAAGGGPQRKGLSAAAGEGAKASAGHTAVMARVSELTEGREVGRAVEAYVELIKDEGNVVTPVELTVSMLQNEPSTSRTERVKEALDAVSALQHETFAKLRESKLAEAEVTDLSNRIGLTVSSTLTKLPLADNLMERPPRVPPEIDETHSVYERIFSILLAYPMYLSNIFRAYVSEEAQEKGVEEPGLADDANFVEVCQAVYGDLSYPRNEHLFLVLCRAIIREELRMSRARTPSEFFKEFAKPASALGLLFATFFRRADVMAPLRDALSQSIADIGMSRAADGSPLDLGYDPLVVYRQVSGSDANSSDASYKSRLFEEPAVKAEVTSRVAKLAQLAQEWFVKVARMAGQLPFGVRWLLRAVHDEVRNRFKAETQSEDEFLFFVSRFMVERYVRPAMQFPRRYGIVDRKQRISAATASNLKHVADMLRRIAGGLSFDGGSKWLQNLNSAIFQLRYDSKTMADTIIGFEDDLPHRMLADMRREHLRLDTQFHVVRLNELRYIRSVLARPLRDVTVKEDDPMKEYATELFPTAVHREQALEYEREPPQKNNGLNLRIETRFDAEPPEQPKVCPMTKVPLPEILAPNDSTEEKLEDRFRLEAGEESKAALREVLREAPEFSSGADSEALESFLQELLDRSKNENLEKALKVQLALGRVREAATRPTGVAEVLVEYLEELDDRARMARDLRTEHDSLRKFSRDVDEFKEEVEQRRLKLATVLKILRDGASNEQNREVVGRAAKRSGVKLTPSDLVRSTHKQAKRNMTKVELDKMGEILGAHAEFSFSELDRAGVIQDFAVSFRSGSKADLSAVTGKLKFVFSMRRPGEFDVMAVYANSMMLDAFSLNVAEIVNLSQTGVVVYTPTTKRGRAKTTFHLGNLIRGVTQEMTMRRLLLT